MVSREVEQWISRNYPKPRIDPEWLEQCYNYLIDELHIASTDTRSLTQNIESQLLQSDLRDSTVAHTGLPDNPGNLHAVNLPPFLLLQVVSCMEIGHSAFSLQNTRQAWVEKADLAGLAGGDDEAEEPAGAFPRYPRGMLSFELSDGYNAIKAIEYRKLEPLKLGQVPLGYKIVLKNVPVRRGVALLQPSNVELRGYANEELDAEREAVLLRGFRERMGLPAEGEERRPAQQGPNGQQQQAGPPPPPPRPAAAAPAQPVPTRPRPRNPNPPDPSQSPYFPDHRPGPSVQLSPVPAHARLQDTAAADETIDFEDDDIDASFLREVELVERQATSQRGSSFLRGATLVGEQIISISDSEEEDKENIPVPQRKRQRTSGPTEVIELSD